jgi:FkbM family methyltransferase
MIWEAALRIGKFLPERIKYRLQPFADMLNHVEKYAIYQTKKVKDDKIISTDYGFDMIIDTSDFVQRRYITDEGSGEDAVTEYIYQKILMSSLDGDFVDIGANVGFYSLMFCQHQPGNSYAFEPLKYNTKRLSQNMSLNDFEDFKVFPVGLSDRTHTSEIHYYPFNKGGAGESQVGSELTLLSRSEQIKLRRLDNMTGTPSNISLMKIDVEGHELDVLKGAEETLRNCYPEIVIETHPNILDDKDQSVKMLIKYIYNLGYENIRLLEDGAELCEVEAINSVDRIKKAHALVVK